MTTGKAQDIEIEGSAVADAILLFRLLEAQPPERRKLKQPSRHPV
jgi:hypothetical protein